MRQAYYSEPNIRVLTDGLQVAHEQMQELPFAILSHRYNSPKGEEYATQGLLRRAQIMARSIDVVFGILPPDRVDVPSRDEISDAMINTQAFVFNLVGSLDNLAWIWLHETDQKLKGGSDFPAQHVGLGPGSKSFRRTLPAPFRARLNGFVDWFEHVENYRHALAHRIPLYIPPFTINPKDEARYREIAGEKEMAMRSRDADTYDRLHLEEQALGVFQPFILHSFDESKPVMLHSQLLTDFATLADIVAALFDALNSPGGAGSGES